MPNRIMNSLNKPLNNLGVVDIETPFQRGFHAAKLGTPLLANPFQKETLEHANWFFGHTIYHIGDEEDRSAYVR